MSNFVLKACELECHINSRHLYSPEVTRGLYERLRESIRKIRGIGSLCISVSLTRVIAAFLGAAFFERTALTAAVTAVLPN